MSDFFVGPGLQHKLSTDFGGYGLSTITMFSAYSYSRLKHQVKVYPILGPRPCLRVTARVTPTTKMLTRTCRQMLLVG